MENEHYNFELIKVINYEKEFGSKVYIFEHQKTGLRVYYSYPTNYVLEMRVSFYTPQINNKGLTHVLEHLLCHTNSRYKDKWYLPSYSNDKTDFNAATFDDHTCFELSSRSITEFRKVVKSMFSSIFRDTFDFTDEEIAFESGYIKDYDTVEGVVYNELKKSIEDPENMADEYSNKVAFAGTHYEYAPGGLITDVMNITREELEEYYYKYYKLSNCKIFASGGFDLFKFFEYLDTALCANAKVEKIDFISNEKYGRIREGRFPFYAPVGYPQGENIYVWGIRLPQITSLEERLVFETCMRALFDGSEGPFDSIIEKELAKRYKKTIIIERSAAPFLRITFYNVPEGKEEFIDTIMNRYLDEVEYLGLDEEKCEEARLGVIREYQSGSIKFFDPECASRMYFLLKDDTFLESSFKKALRVIDEISAEQISEISAALCDEQCQFKFVMYPDMPYVADIEDNFIANYEDYKLYEPVIENYGEIIAKSLRMNCTKQEVTKKLTNLKKALDEIKFEKIKCENVDVYKFEDEVRFVNFTFDLRGLTDDEMCYLPALVKLINRGLPKKHDLDVAVDAAVIQNKVQDEYFRLEIKCYFRNDAIDLSFFDSIYSSIDHISPQQLARYLVETLSVLRRGGSEKLTRDLAVRMDSTDIPYRGTVHRKTFYDALFNSGSQDANKAFESYCDFHDVCFKVLRRSNLTIMTTSGILNKYEAGCDPEKLVEVVKDFEDVDMRKTERKYDKDMTYHYANLTSSATGVIKVDKLNNFELGKKMVCDRVLYNFVYILFRQLGLSYQIDGTLAGEYVTITTHAIRCSDDYRSAFNACGSYFENFDGNLNHYKSKALDLLLDMFIGRLEPKLTVFRYVESGISFEDIVSIGDAIENMTSEDLKEVGKLLKDSSYEAKVYAVCGPGSSPYTLDDCGFNYDYIFPDFLI